MDAVIPDALVLVRGRYDTGGFLGTGALLSSDAVFCKALGSRSSRCPEKLPLVVVVSAGNPPEPGSGPCPGGVFADKGARLC